MLGPGALGANMYMSNRLPLPMPLGIEMNVGAPLEKRFAATSGGISLSISESANRVEARICSEVKYARLRTGAPILPAISSLYSHGRAPRQPRDRGEIDFDPTISPGEDLERPVLQRHRVHDWK